jgi:L-ascorbate metabolism protein UlaG (beta-lactamase superfamily)
LAIFYGADRDRRFSRAHGSGLGAARITIESRRPQTLSARAHFAPGDAAGRPGHRLSRITELDWWESHSLPHSGLTVTAAPSQHFSGRGLKDRNATLWSSFVIRSERHAVFFSGDTGLTTEYQSIRDRLGPFDLVMLEVGAFHPAWGDIHLGPQNALKAHTLLGGGAFLPVHWGTFSLAMHAWGQPVEPAHAGRVEPWWRQVDAVVQESKADAPETTLPKAMSWPID